MKNSQTKGFANIILITLVVVLAGVLGYVILVKKPAVVEQQQPNTADNTLNTLPTTTVISNTSTQVDENVGWKTYTNTKKGYSVSYPADAKIDLSNSSCVRILTKEFGSVSINSGSGDPCGEPTGIGTGMIRINENITIANKQYLAHGYRESDNSYSFLSFDFTIGDKIFTTYGVTHFDKNNPVNWSDPKSLTDSEYQKALTSARQILLTLKVVPSTISTAKVESTQNPVSLMTTDSLRIKNYLLGHLPILRTYAEVLFGRSNSYGVVTMNCAEFFTVDGITIPTYIPEYAELKQFFAENNIQAKCYAVNTGISITKIPTNFADSYAISANGVCVDYTGGYMGYNFSGEATIGQFNYSGKVVTHAICKKTQ